MLTRKIYVEVARATGRGCLTRSGKYTTPVSSPRGFRSPTHPPRTREGHDECLTLQSHRRAIRAPILRNHCQGEIIAIAALVIGLEIIAADGDDRAIGKVAKLAGDRIG